MTALRVAVSIRAAVLLCSLGAAASADTFGTGANQFTMDFVPISGSTNPTSGYGMVNNDYRMGTYEVSNAQWNKFKAAYGTLTGSPLNAYDQSSFYTGANVPTNCVSRYEAAQFVNWLNTSTGHHAAYNFTGTQGTSNYALATWSAAEADNGTNLYRHKDAKYYLPSEDEWVKAAYWNGTALQTYATKAGDTLFQGNGVSGTGWNYYNGHYVVPYGPWAVGSGSQELNGTFDMMGNVWEWMESPWTSSIGGMRGGSYQYFGMAEGLASSFRYDSSPDVEDSGLGFRVASEVPEPISLALLSLGGLALLKTKRRA